MLDLCIFSLSSAMLYFLSMAVINYANGKSKKTRRNLICLVVVVFSIVNGWCMYVNENKIPLATVEKEWNRYVKFCKQEHISWNEITFPEWLSMR